MRLLTFGLTVELVDEFFTVTCSVGAGAEDPPIRFSTFLCAVLALAGRL